MRKPYLRGRGPHFPILDTITQYDFEPGYVVFTMPSPKRLRVKVGELIVADSAEALVLQESDHLPVYYFPIKDVEESFLMPSTTRTECPYKGVASHYSLNTGVTLVQDAGWRYLEPVKGCPPIAGQPFSRNSASNRANRRSAAPARANCSRKSQMQRRFQILAKQLGISDFG